jgi:hypothetical protein
VDTVICPGFGGVGLLESAGVVVLLMMFSVLAIDLNPWVGETSRQRLVDHAGSGGLSQTAFITERWPAGLRLRSA